MSDEPFAAPDREAELALWRKAKAAEDAGPAADPELAGIALPGGRQAWIEQAGAAGVEGWTVLDEAGNPTWIEGSGRRSEPTG